MIEIVPNWHPLFVHFTVALLILSVLFFIIQRPLAETEIGDNFLVFARYTLGLGIFFTVFTVIAGIDAYNTVDHDTPSHLAMKDHRLWALVTAGVFLLAWIWSLFSLKGEDKGSLTLIAILLVGTGLLVNTGHKGSLLVYYYGLGVESMPATDEHDHAAHDHDGGHEHSDGGHDQGATHDHGEEGHASTEEHAHDDSAHAHDDEHTHSESVSTMQADGHAHSHDDTIESEAAKESVEPEVITDKDGIVRETLPEVDMPLQKGVE